MGLGFNTLLASAGLDTDEVSLLFHNAPSPRYRRTLPWLAAERHDLFEAYQATHSLVARRTLMKRPLVASFVPHGDDTMALVGVYRITSVDVRPTAEIFADPRYDELSGSFGLTEMTPALHIARAEREHRFNMERLDALANLSGRVVVPRPKGRAYVRLAARLDAPVLQIAQTSVLSAGSAYGEGTLSGRGQIPDAEARDGIELEHNWMNRLHTRTFGLNA